MKKDTKVYKSPMMTFMFVLFLSLVIATFWRINTALETHPGLVVDDAYLSGKSYGDTLDAKKVLIKQGWALDLSTPKPVSHLVPQTYTANSSQHNKTLLGANVMAYFYRPLDPTQDFSVPMLFENDIYQAQVSLPLKGRWDLVVEVIKADFLQRASVNLFAR